MATGDQDYSSGMTTTDNTFFQVGRVVFGDPPVYPWSGNATITTSSVTMAQEEKETMRSERALYEVYIVDPKTDDILMRGELFIAKSEEGAEYKALRKINYGGDLEDLDIEAINIMALRDKPKVQQVEVVEKA